MKNLLLFLLPLLHSIIKVAVNAMTPVLRTELETFMQKWKVKADKTPNPWDNYLVDLFYELLDI